MNKVILVTGEPRVGKTTLLKMLINAIGKEQCGGFYTEEVLSQGKRIGFKIVNLEGQSKLFARKNLKSPIMVGNYSVDIGVLESFGIQAINNAITHKNFIIVDEIGPMEMASSKFQQIILEIINGSYNLLGTIVLRSYPITDIIKKHPKVEIIYLSLENRDKITDKIIKKIKILN